MKKILFALFSITMMTLFTSCNKEQYTITAEANDPAMGTVTGGGVYDLNATATLTATPAEGYEFVSWSDNNTDNPRNITVSADATYTAIFQAVQGGGGETGGGNEGGDEQNPLSFFVGEYDLNIEVIECFIDGVPSSGENEQWPGTMSISLPEGADYVVVEGYFNLAGGSTPLMIYNTTGTLTADGKLQLDNNQFSNNMLTMDISYEPIAPQQPLVWNSSMSCEGGGMTFTYELTNTATRTAARK